MGILKNKVLQITVFIIFIITSLLLTLFCGANQGSKTKESIYEYNGLTYTIVTNNAFYDNVDIEITDVAFDDAFKNELSEKLPGIKFTDPNVIEYSSGIRPTTGSFDKEQLTQKAIDKLKELKLYPEYKLNIWAYTSVRGQLLNSESRSEFNITNLFMHLRPAYRGIPLINENGDENDIILTGNGELEGLSFYNNDVRISSKLGKLKLLPVEKIIKKFR